MDLAGRDLLDVSDLSDAEVTYVLDEAAAVKQDLDAGRSVATAFARPPILLTLFYEPSTRTRLSFESAMLRLGGRVLSVEAALASSSASKGETLEDTGRVVAAYADVIVVRHPEVGTARRLADACDIPVINGGDGRGSHPTQALLDVFTIREELGRLSGLTVAVIGDLAHARTAHSFIRLLARYEPRLVLVSPPALRLPVAALPEDVPVEQVDEVTPFLSQLDVIYVTRIQRERFAEGASAEFRGSFRLTREHLAQAPEHLRVLHPLPRVDEIAPEVDACPQAAYFRQAHNGIPVRTALFRALLTEQRGGAAPSEPRS